MKPDWRIEVPCWLLLAGMFLLAALTWTSAPDRIPMHWGADFQPDRYGGKFEGLLAIPLLSLALYLFLWILPPRIDPGRANYPRFAVPYGVFRLAVTAFMAGIYGLVHLWLRGIERTFAASLPLLLGGLFVVIGNLLGKIRPNWFFGIRTPWTLTSKIAWVRTHRLGGWLFVTCGLLWMASALVRRAWAPTSVMIILIAGVIGLAVYSYAVWRHDPDRVSPAGTDPS